MRFPRIVGLIAAGALTLSIAAPVGAANDAMVRVLHASPDAPAVDVWVDGSKVLTNVAFKGLSSYLPLPAGAHNIKVVATGTTTPALIDATPTFDAGKKYTVAAIGKAASVAAKVIVDDGATVAGSAKLRVIHLSPDAPAVDVAVAGQAPADAPVKNLSYPDATGYLTLAPNSYNFEVRLTGTTTVALPLPGVALAAGTNYTVFAVGLAAADVPAGQVLSVVVGVDGVAAPATDTIPAGNSAPALFLAAGAIFALAFALRFAPARNRAK